MDTSIETRKKNIVRAFREALPDEVRRALSQQTLYGIDTSKSLTEHHKFEEIRLSHPELYTQAIDLLIAARLDMADTLPDEVHKLGHIHQFVPPQYWEYQLRTCNGEKPEAKPWHDRVPTIATKNDYLHACRKVLQLDAMDATFQCRKHADKDKIIGNCAIERIEKGVSADTPGHKKEVAAIADYYQSALQKSGRGDLFNEARYSELTLLLGQKRPAAATSERAR